MASEREARVTALETSMQTMDDRLRMSEQDAAAARSMAGGAERGVIALREEVHADLNTLREQNNRLHNATRQDITGLRGEVNGLRGEVNGLRGEVTDLRQRVETGFTEVDKGFANIRGRLDAMAAGQGHIVTMLTELINRPDPHDHD